VLGGTFDPPHLGHLHAALAVRRAFALARVLLVPCAVPPHKRRADLTEAFHRLAMARLAVEACPGLEVATLELEREGPSYTIDTLRALERGSPPLRPLLIVGWDALLDLPTWHRHEELVSEFDVVAVHRSPESDAGPERRPDASLARRVVEVPAESGAGAALESGREEAGGRIYRLMVPPVLVSSSRVRALAAASAPLAGLVPTGVDRYIQAHRLYRRKEEAR